MKLNFRLTLIFLLITTGCLAQKTYSYQTIENDPMHTRIYTLDNGLKIYLSVNKEKPRIQADIAVRTGSRNDPHETTGLAHYLEHLMFKGTDKFGTTDYAKEKPYLDDIEARYESYRKLTDPAARKKAYHEIDSVSQLAAKYNIPNEYDKMMASIGSEGSNAYTSNEVTCYTENIPSNEVENWAKVQGDRFQNMVIRGFHTELEAVYEEYNIGLANDGNKEWDALMKKLFPTHPYGTQTTIGTQQHLKNPSITRIKQYFQRYYVPNNVAICMAGDFDPDQVVAILDKYFGTWKKSDQLSRPEFAPQPAITAPKDTTVLGLEAENVILGWRFPAAQEAACDTLDLISDLLSNGTAGLLDLNLNQPMKVQGAGSETEELTDYSAFVMEGMPKQGQTLEQVRALLLEQLDQLKRGDFSDNLLPSVINNKKLNYMKGLLSNENRVNNMVDAFINRKKWEQVYGRLLSQEKMTKEQIVNFAKAYLNNNFVCVYKRIGTDTTQKKIDKPQITPIPSNRQYSSQFLRDVESSKVQPIAPVFVDFHKDLEDTKTNKGLPLLYKQNTTDKLFNLSFYYDFGTEDDKEMDLAADYLTYLGTDKMTPAQVKQAFYALACQYDISVSNNTSHISLTGLSENMPKALDLLTDLINHAKADKSSYDQFVDLILKSREDAKKKQSSNFRALCDYALYGPYNPSRNQYSQDQLRSFDPQKLISHLKKLLSMQQTVLYFGPLAEPQLDLVLGKGYPTPAKLLPVPVGKPYTEQPTPKNEILLAPYQAKNIYMRMYNEEGVKFDPSQLARKELFNEYFGGGMNAIVFQELRESRGLAYNAYASYNYMPRYDHPEYFFTHIISQNDKMMDCIRVFHEIMDTIPQSQRTFDVSKQSLDKEIRTGRITRNDILVNYYNWTHYYHLQFDPRQRAFEDLPGLQMKDIVDFAGKYIARKPYRYAILGDKDNIDVNGLSKIAPIRNLTTEEIFGY
jgi:predicted Zn-dependent peptidase